MTAVGIVAKARLERAAGHLAQIAAWLQQRKITPVFDADTAGLARSAGANGRLTIVDRDELPRHVDVIVVLGGDGTLLGTAGRIYRRRQGRQPVGLRVAQTARENRCLRALS